MKLILLAATALMAAPLMAQTTTTDGAAAPTTQVDPAAPPAAADPAMAAPEAMAAPAPEAMPAPQAMTTGDPVGGYQPATPPTSTGAAGASVVFQPSASPAQAFPAPAALETYPVCKKGQYDKCRQRGGK